MPDRQTTLHAIRETLGSFNTGSLAENATALFGALGYASDKVYKLEHSNYQSFYEDFAQSVPTFRPDKASTDDWRSVDILFQLANDDLEHDQTNLFERKALEQERFDSFVFMAIDLTPRANNYTRTALAQITREVNKCFLMPIVMLFQHGDTLTLSVIQRRQNKREGEKDVLEKVILIKDINTKKPHRAHLEILTDLSLEQLTTRHKHRINNFETLFKVWQEALDTTELNKRFYKELSNWYFWALRHAQFPDLPQQADNSEQHSNRTETALIRLITRLIFVWFIKEKGLVPEKLFDRQQVNSYLTREHQIDNAGSSYYRAILQNLFFATLNTESNRDVADSRGFKTASHKGQRSNKEYMAHTRYRYQQYFNDPAAAVALFDPIPFLNGGLFECLDKAAAESASGQETRFDGFSDDPRKQAVLPDFLFFGEDDVDLNDVYGTNRRRPEHVMGIVRIFERYKFTIDENTPIEEEVALDPELLGKVFENLLASYNPETSTTARKQTGSFYTPREIVNYMVDESLIAYLTTPLQERMRQEDAERHLRELFAYDTHNPFDEEDTTRLISSIDNLKILDPACGSGAFPIGILQRLVTILGKLDPDNERWKAQQLEREIAPVQQDIRIAKQISDEEARKLATEQLESRLADIRQAFEENDHDYARKLFLIENCIYGVDIQPIAVQIAKLRCFISLIVDQRVDEHAENRGVLPLPNLETKFVAANTLIGIDKPAQATFEDPALTAKQDELKQLRHEHFQARRWQKKKALRQKDKKLRHEIAELLKGGIFKGQEDTAENLANWNPYDQNASAGFFDAEWMFGVTGGFGVVIGNPPYISAVEGTKSNNKLRDTYKKLYPLLQGAFDTYAVFLLFGERVAQESGVYVWIIPNKFLVADYAENVFKYLESTGLKYTIDVSSFNVFENTGVYPIILFGNKKSKSRFKKYEISKVDDLRYRDLKEKQVHFTGYKTFKDFALKVGSGATGFQAKQLIEYISEEPYSKAIPFVVSGCIDPYIVEFTNVRYMKNRYEKAYIYKGEGVADSKWSFWSNEKIVIAGMTKRIEASYVKAPLALGVGVYAIYDYGAFNPHFLLGVLNSKFISYYLKYKFSDKHLAGGYLAINKSTIEKLPLVAGSSNQQQQISKLASNILTVKQHDPKADVSALEREIDALVYELYGLTEDEIALVEGEA